MWLEPRRQRGEEQSAVRFGESRKPVLIHFSHLLNLTIREKGLLLPFSQSAYLVECHNNLSQQVFALFI